MSKIVKGFKVFEEDWTCRPCGNVFQFKVGEYFEEDVKPISGEQGFHFCKRLIECARCYYIDRHHKYAEILALGDIDEVCGFYCTNKIAIVREIPWEEVSKTLNMDEGCAGIGNTGKYNKGTCNSGDCNDGDYNSGFRNFGYRNSGGHNVGIRNTGIYNNGNYNSGDYNSGIFNSGNFNGGCYNSGDFNECNYSSGVFNTTPAAFYMFNKPSDWNFTKWRGSDAYRILKRIPRDTLKYIKYEDMTDAEKKEFPDAKITGGYLKLVNASDVNAWWQSLEEVERKIVTSLPNFDPAIFERVTKIKV